MADIKITDLAAYTDPVSTDVLPIVDVGSDLTKKVSIADLLKNALLVDSNGDVEIGGGNTQLNADGEALFSGPVSIGGTASANTIDEYEEGNWTPGISAQSGSFTALNVEVIAATYTKIGRIVTVACFIRTDAYDPTGTSGRLVITGLPFNHRSGVGRTIGTPLLLEYNSESTYSGTFAAFTASSASNQVYFVKVDEGTNSGAVTYLQTSQLQTHSVTNRNWFQFALTYMTV